MTYRECYAYGCEVLEQAQIADARLDARLLLEYICHTTQHDLILNGRRELSDAEQKEYKGLIAKRAERIPLQHITGEQEFMGFTFKVNEHVLIPRQDTEILVEEALNILNPGMKVLDMCTGSGCILLSLLVLAKDCEGIGADIYVNALKVAKENLKNISAQCGKELPAEFVESDLFTRFEQ
jgi:release factor glutamine methyltransferase